MANLYNGPPRGGTRGGKDQFNWDNVKNDKDKTYYLGHSVKALSGRWQSNKDVYWWTKGKGEDASAMQTELEAVKEREAELMAEALGLQPKKRKVAQQPQLSPAELAELMRKARGEGEEEPPAAPGEEADRVKGLGFRPGPAMAGGVAQREVMAGEGLEPAERQNGGSAAPALPPPPSRPPTELQLALMVAQQKAEKRAKKAAKKAKKLAKSIAKAEKKEKRRKDKHKHRHSSAAGGNVAAQPAAASSEEDESSDSRDEQHAQRDDERTRSVPETAREPTRGNAEHGRASRLGGDVPGHEDTRRERNNGRSGRRRDGSPSRHEVERHRRRSRSRSPEHKRRR